jgi:hypothetical protein
MKIQRDPHAGKQAVVWLATVFVFIIGAAATAFMILSMTDRAGWQNWTVWAISFAGIALLLWSIHSPKEAKQTKGWLGMWLQAADRSDPLRDYKFRPKSRPPGEPLGSQQPPTLESIRDASQQTIKWVPHGPPNGRKRPGK